MMPLNCQQTEFVDIISKIKVLTSSKFRKVIFNSSLYATSVTTKTLQYVYDKFLREKCPFVMAFVNLFTKETCHNYYSKKSISHYIKILKLLPDHVCKILDGISKILITTNGGIYCSIWAKIIIAFPDIDTNKYPSMKRCLSKL